MGIIKRERILVNILSLAGIIFVLLSLQQCRYSNGDRIIISCSEINDLFVTLKDNNIPCTRYDDPYDAVAEASEGSGVMIMADGYPERTTDFDSILFRKAVEKQLRVYLEYPSWLPGLTAGRPRSTDLERVVVTTGSISQLEKMDILSIHGCHFVPFDVQEPLLAAGRVAGYDHAVYGLDSSDRSPVLFMLPGTEVMVSTTKLSQFITARYAPKRSMQALWEYILKFIEGEPAPQRSLDWIPDVRPSYTREEKLPGNAARTAVKRGIEWHTTARMLLNEEGWEEYKQLWNLNDSNMQTTVPAVNNAAPAPVAQPGDGSYGVLEGIASEVHLDGSQPVRWWLRSDSNGESSLAFALKGEMDGDSASKRIAGNLLDWLYFTSGLFQNDPGKANYGLLFWAPGNAQALYQDNDIKAILGCMGTSAILDTDRWDEVLVKNILGNFRTTGINGFRGRRIENPDLLRDGWQHYFGRNIMLFQPHYEAWTWASYLWLYDKTEWKPLLEKTRKAITLMMNEYPDGWRWTNGIQQERGRMLLPLSWLIRVDDRPEYREWLKLLAEDIERSQDRTGAIREELGSLEMGDYVPSVSNESYGTNEAPLIQENGDPVADLLYTCNFTFLGLHEACAATGDVQYKRMADKLTDFLIRIQVKSEKHSGVDGGWFRAFDYRQWEYLGSNADSGWGAWSIETGWTQAWIPSVLAMREMNTSLWEITFNSKAGRKFDKIRREMIPDGVVF